jgi:hypothetical protein
MKRREPGEKKSSVATRRARADGARVEPDDGEANTPQLQSAGQSGAAESDDADVGGGVARECGKGPCSRVVPERSVRAELLLEIEREI